MTSICSICRARRLETSVVVQVFGLLIRDCAESNEVTLTHKRGLRKSLMKQILIIPINGLPSSVIT
jgi:hypothetical protein